MVVTKDVSRTFFFFSGEDHEKYFLIGIVFIFKHTGFSSAYIIFAWMRRCLCVFVFVLGAQVGKHGDSKS